MRAERCDGSVKIFRIAVPLLGFPQHGIAHTKLYGLIRFVVRVCDDMQPHDVLFQHGTLGGEAR